MTPKEIENLRISHFHSLGMLFYQLPRYMVNKLTMTSLINYDWIADRVSDLRPLNKARRRGKASPRAQTALFKGRNTATLFNRETTFLSNTILRMTSANSISLSNSKSVQFLQKSAYFRTCRSITHPTTICICFPFIKKITISRRKNHTYS